MASLALGAAVLHSTYEMATPVHNFKATVDWLTDEVFSPHSQPNLSHQASFHLWQRLGDIAGLRSRSRQAA